MEFYVANLLNPGAPIAVRRRGFSFSRRPMVAPHAANGLGQSSAASAWGCADWFYPDYEPYADRGRPSVAINGAYAGIAELGGAFYRNVPPGRYVATVETHGIDFNQIASFDLASCQEAYVKIVSSPSSYEGGDKRVVQRPTYYAWLIPNDAARADVAHLVFYCGS